METKWKTIEPKIWKPENEQDSIEGILVSKEPKNEQMNYGFRVKAPVARRPPHRSGREDLPHPVPRCCPFLRTETKTATTDLACDYAAHTDQTWWTILGLGSG